MLVRVHMCVRARIRNLVRSEDDMVGHLCPIRSDPPSPALYCLLVVALKEK